jgi:hypothetical protein
MCTLVGKTRNAYEIMKGKFLLNQPLRGPRKLESNIKIYGSETVVRL